MTSSNLPQPLPPKKLGPALYQYRPPYEGHGSYPVDRVIIQYNCPHCNALAAIDFDSYLRSKNPVITCRTCSTHHQLPLIPCYYADCTGNYAVCQGERYSVRDENGDWDNICPVCGVRYPGHVASKTRCGEVYCNVCKRSCPSAEALPKLLG